MKVVLLKKIKKLGNEGDIINVADGYAINFLIPQGQAVKATEHAVQAAETIKANRIAHKEEITKNAKKYADKISSAIIKFKRKVSSGDKLFGAISEKDIIDAIEKDLKIALEKKQIKMAHHIKTTGKHEVEIHLAEKINAKITIEIEAE